MRDSVSHFTQQLENLDNIFKSVLKGQMKDNTFSMSYS